MAESVKMSSKNQIVVPKEAREALKLRPGDRLLVSVEEAGDGPPHLRMERQPEDLADELEGALDDLGGEGGGVWPELADA